MVTISITCHWSNTAFQDKLSSQPIGKGKLKTVSLQGGGREGGGQSGETIIFIFVSVVGPLVFPIHPGPGRIWIKLRKFPYIFLVDTFPSLSNVCVELELEPTNEENDNCFPVVCCGCRVV